MVLSHSPFFFSRFSARRQGGRGQQLTYNARAHTGLRNGMGGPQLQMTEGKYKDSPDLARSSSAQSPQPPQKKTTSQAQETRVPGHSPRGLPTSASSKRFLWVDFASHPDTPPPTSPTTWLALLPPTLASHWCCPLELPTPAMINKGLWQERISRPFINTVTALWF